MEDIERVGLTQRESERIDIDRAADRRVNAAEINHQLIVDEDPDVIVAREPEISACSKTGVGELEFDEYV